MKADTLTPELLPGRPARRGHGLLRRCAHAGNTRRRFHFARAPARAKNPGGQAYELYEQHGRPGGRAVQDWLQAEQKSRRKKLTNDAVTSDNIKNPSRPL